MYKDSLGEPVDIYLSTPLKKNLYKHVFRTRVYLCSIFSNVLDHTPFRFHKKEGVAKAKPKGPEED